MFMGICTRDTMQNGDLTDEPPVDVMGNNAKVHAYAPNQFGEYAA